MFKNLSIRQIAIISSSAIILLMAIVYFIIESIFSNSPKENFWITSILLIIVGGIVSYFILRYFLDIFIYRKIKLIYKVIRKSKVSTEEKRNEVGLLENVELEVSKWVEDQQKEIESLRALETYRRDYVGNISHELKTPIFNIQGYIHTLLDGGLEDQ